MVLGLSCGKTDSSNAIISPGTAACIASRNVLEPLSSALKTTKVFPSGVGISVEVGGTFVSVGSAIVGAGTVIVLVGDGFGPQAPIASKRIANRYRIITFLTIFSPKVAERFAIAARGRDGTRLESSINPKQGKCL